jgi:alpha-galactosidase/6-phospho-beta-glucosidase family protein
MGRKSKLTPEVQAEIVRALQVGATREHAWQYAGISHECFYNWLRQGEAGKQPYSDFYEAIKKAEARAVVGWLAQIEEAARTGSWQAAAWKLERRYFRMYGRTMQDEGTAQLPDIHVHVHTARERLDARLSHLYERHQEDAPHDTA